jgi:hypothetical protein
LPLLFFWAKKMSIPMLLKYQNYKTLKIRSLFIAFFDKYVILITIKQVKSITLMRKGP